MLKKIAFWSGHFCVNVQAQYSEGGDRRSNNTIFDKYLNNKVKKIHASVSYINANQYYVSPSEILLQLAHFYDV